MLMHLMRGNYCQHGHDECEHGRDERGIALQTIIIMVVLIAVAGTVSVVLLNRAGTETDRLESEDDRWSGILNKTGCEMASGAWNDVSDTCGAPGTAIHNLNTPHGLTATECHSASEGDPAHTHTFTPGTDNSTPPDGDFDDPGDVMPTCTHP